ncbi:MAG: protoporphyrinogen oxidase [Ilumatobacteraceae bacterium]|nr:protoporphyrinogen oxidase [Ilumatobacteraceae bacterium]
MSGSPSRIAVIGAGITGLSAAHEAAVAGGDRVEVTLFDGSGRAGGLIKTSTFAGLRVDEGADAFLRRVPEALTLARSVGLDERLTSPTAGSAAVWVDGLRRLPEGLVLGVPTSTISLARSRLVSPVGAARALADLVLPRRALDHDSIGAWVRGRLGEEVHDRLTDALVGSIYAADTDRFSLAAVPQLDALARGGRSAILTALRQRRPSDSGPVFAAPSDGMGSLADAVLTAAVAAGAMTRLEAPVEAVEAGGGGVLIDGERFEAAILATPARVSARLLASSAPAAAAGLGSIETAGVVMVTLAIPGDSLPAACSGLSGYLVPKSRQQRVTAVSFASNKWAHLRPADGAQILRVSLGRDGMDVSDLDDREVIDSVVDEVSAHLGAEIAPTEVRVTRWPSSFPQYRPHHGALVATIERSLPATIVAAGASLHGIGVPACVGSGRRAAQSVLSRLGIDGHRPEPVPD